MITNKLFSPPLHSLRFLHSMPTLTWRKLTQRLCQIRPPFMPIRLIKHKYSAISPLYLLCHLQVDRLRITEFRQPAISDAHFRYCYVSTLFDILKLHIDKYRYIESMSKAVTMYRYSSHLKNIINKILVYPCFSKEKHWKTEKYRQYEWLDSWILFQNKYRYIRFC